MKSYVEKQISLIILLIFEHSQAIKISMFCWYWLWLHFSHANFLQCLPEWLGTSLSPNVSSREEDGLPFSCPVWAEVRPPRQEFTTLLRTQNNPSSPPVKLFAKSFCNPLLLTQSSIGAAFRQVSRLHQQPTLGKSRTNFSFLSFLSRRVETMNQRGKKFAPNGTFYSCWESFWEGHFAITKARIDCDQIFS